MVVTYTSADAVLDAVSKAPGDCVILLGQTGGGKSSVANAILNLDQNVAQALRKFPEGEDLKSQTKDVHVEAGKWFGEDSKENVTVIDIPGLLDTDNRGSEFLACLSNLLQNLPPQRLRLLIITLPLTESRAKSTYGEMLEIIDGLFHLPNLSTIWERVCFVYTCSNLLSDQPERLATKREGWNEYLIARGVENPFFVEFKYGDPFSLEQMRQKFISVDVFTPTATAEMTSFVLNDPCASVADRVDKCVARKRALDEWTKALDGWTKAFEKADREISSLTKAPQTHLEKLLGDKVSSTDSIIRGHLITTSSSTNLLPIRDPPRILVASEETVNCEQFFGIPIYPSLLQPPPSFNIENPNLNSPNNFTCSVLPMRQEVDVSQLVS